MYVIGCQRDSEVGTFIFRKSAEAVNKPTHFQLFLRLISPSMILIGEIFPNKKEPKLGIRLFFIWNYDASNAITMQNIYHLLITSILPSTQPLPPSKSISSQRTPFFNLTLVTLTTVKGPILPMILPQEPLIPFCERCFYFCHDYLQLCDDDESKLLPGGDSFFSKMHILQVPELHQDDVNSLLSKMVREERIRDDRSSLLCTLMLQELLVMCGRVCHFLQDAPADIHTTDRSILQAARFITGHYMEPITTADIAREAGLTPNYLTRKFREATGLGLKEYLIFTRLQHAAMELVSTDASITDIAQKCGFSDGNYFKDVFKKSYGMGPRAYRKKA